MEDVAQQGQKMTRSVDVTGLSDEAVAAVEQFVSALKKQAAQAPLTGEEWRREFEAWTKEIEGRKDRYPPGFQVDYSRESIYREREDSQL